MSVQDWYRRALGGSPTPTQPPQPTYQPNLPPTHAGMPVQYQPQQVYQQPGPGAYQPAPQQHNPLPTNMTEAIDYMNRNGWRGGEGTSSERYTCPRCGSALFFTRAKIGRIMGMPPAPRCASCGYNGLFEQFGDQPVRD